MSRFKVCSFFMFLIGVTLIDWRISVGIVVALFGLDVLLQKEEEENLQDVKDYIEEKRRLFEQEKKDLRFKKIMEENGDGFNRKSKVDTWL